MSAYLILGIPLLLIGCLTLTFYCCQNKCFYRSSPWCVKKQPKFAKYHAAHKPASLAFEESEVLYKGKKDNSCQVSLSFISTLTDDGVTLRGYYLKYEENPNSEKKQCKFIPTRESSQVLETF